MCHWKGYIFLFFLASCPIYSAAINLSQCFQDVISCAQNSSGCSMGISNTTALSILLTSQGNHVTSTSVATAISYTGCNTYCGTGKEDFSWAFFSRQYAAWLLPYLVMVSQLPFGARRRIDNLMSAVLTLGSPALAAYSLYMTILNARWVNDQLFAGINYPSVAVRQSVVRVLSGLQQVPLRVHPGNSAQFESLIVHPENDSWWAMLAEELNCSYTLSIASAISIIWVVIAYLLSVADSISNVPDNINFSGQGTGSLWLWLLPIVVGWLVLSPKCDYSRIHKAYNKANRHAYTSDSDDPITMPTYVRSNFGLTISSSPDRLYDGAVTSPDELRTPPVFNYARIFSWYRNVYLTSLYYRAAWRKSTHRVSVDGTFIPENFHNDVPQASRTGTREQIIHYCRPDDSEYLGEKNLWPPGLLFNMVVASLMSLQLQWGTTGAALLLAWFTPTVGLGCRSLAYLIYGTLSTAVWMLLVLSSALGYYAHHLPDDRSAFDLKRVSLYAHPNASKCSSSESNSPRLPTGQSDLTLLPMGIYAEDKDILSDTSARKRPTTKHHTTWVKGETLARVADGLRWIGKALAIVNAIGLVANALFQFSGVYASCYCSSNVYALGASAFSVLSPNTSDVDLAKTAWMSALALALASCSFFVGSMYVLRDALPF